MPSTATCPATDAVLPAQGVWLTWRDPEPRFCTRVLWPLFHGFPERARCDEDDWRAYVTANQRSARDLAARAHPSAAVWIDDYCLLLAGQALRALGHHGRIGLFLHVPFPAPEVFETLPWSRELADALCDLDVVGVQTQQFAANFTAAIERTKSPGRRVPEVGVFPVPIDPRPFREPGDELREIAGLRSTLGDRRLIVAVDRLCHASGIPERLAAYERLLERSTEWHRRVSLLQVSVPADSEPHDYAALRERVERMVGRINGQFADTDWVPVRYLYRAYDVQVLAQLYRLADVALATPLRDGMTRVAKEFVAAQDPEHPGVLVLSQSAGAAEALAAALFTNPFHPEGQATDLDRALRMPPAERRERHRALSAAIEREGDPQTWARTFLAQLASPRLRILRA